MSQSKSGLYSRPMQSPSSNIMKNTASPSPISTRNTSIQDSTSGLKYNELEMKFSKEYNNIKDNEKKKEYISNYMTKFTSFDKIIFDIIYKNIIPKDSTREHINQIDIFDHFINEIKRLYEKDFEGLLLGPFLEEFIESTNILIHISRLCSEYLQKYSRLAFSIQRKICEKLNNNRISKLINELCYIDIIDIIMQIKPSNNNKTSSNLHEFFNETFIRKFKYSIEYIYRYILKDNIGAINIDLMPVLLKWLLIINPEINNINEYILVLDISNSCIEICRKSERLYNPKKLYELFHEIFGILSNDYSNQNLLKGYSNYVNIIKLLSFDDIRETINDHFISFLKEANNEINVFLTIFENMINSGLVGQIILLIYQFSLNLKTNMMWNWLYDIFNKIILKYMIMKVRIKRCSLYVVQLLEFYIYGFIHYVKITPDIIQQLIENLKFLMIQAYREMYNNANTNSINSASNANSINFSNNNNNGYIGSNINPMKKEIVEYVTFLLIIIHYKEDETNKDLYKDLKIMIDNVIKELDIIITIQQKNDLINSINQDSIFNITESDLNKIQYKITAIETFYQSCKPDYKYKACYINSVIQALYMTQKFRQEIMGLTPSLTSSTITNKNTILSLSKKPGVQKRNEITVKEYNQVQPQPHEALYQLFTKLTSSKEYYIDPMVFRESLPDLFKNSYEQQDASEFIKLYLDYLESSLKPTPIHNLINECFSGENIETIKCHKCPSSPITQTAKFLDLILNFDKTEKEHDLLQMIKKAYVEEEFKDENKFFCEKCNKHSELSTKKTQISRYPEYLIITLNRFFYDQTIIKKIKICDYVRLYENFNFKTISNEFKSTQYKMYAFIVHTGDSAEAGHYYIVARDQSDMWYLFNDRDVLALGNMNFEEYFKDYETETPYMLFYAKVSELRKPKF